MNTRREIRKDYWAEAESREIHALRLEPTVWKEILYFEKYDTIHRVFHFVIVLLQLVIQFFWIFETQASWFFWLFTSVRRNGTEGTEPCSAVRPHNSVVVETIFSTMTVTWCISCTLQSTTWKMKHKWPKIFNDDKTDNVNQWKESAAGSSLPRRFLWCPPTCGRRSWTRVSECTCPANSLAWYGVCGVLTLLGTTKN